MSSDRAGAYPHVATAAEQGLARLKTPLWIGLSAPRGTPADVLNALQKALSAALDDPKVREDIAKLGADIPPRTQRGLKFTDEFVRQEVENWNALAKATNVVKQ